MTARLKALERQLACLRAQAALGPVADDFAACWGRSLEEGHPLPDVLDLVEAAVRIRVPIIDITSLDAYLRQCVRVGRVPDSGRLVMAVVHGYAEARFIGMNGEACACPARQLLIKPRSHSDGSGGEREGPSLRERIARSLEGMSPESVSHLMRR